MLSGNAPQYDPMLIEALKRIIARAQVALTQGPLSRRNALEEIEFDAQETLKLGDPALPKG